MVKLQNRYVYKNSYKFIFDLLGKMMISYHIGIYVIWGSEKFLSQNRAANEKSLRSAGLKDKIHCLGP